MESLFNRPYIFEADKSKRWRLSLLFSLFVFLFLLVFKPFGLSNIPHSLLLICLGYGCTCFLIMALLNVAIIQMFPKLFVEEKWTLGNEIGWAIVNIAIIGFANFLFSAVIGIVNFALTDILLFECYTMAIGVFPTVISILLNEARLKKKFKRETHNINTVLTQPNTFTKDSETLESVPTEKIIIRSDNNNESLILLPHDLLFVKSADNYIEVYYLLNENVTKKLVRTSLKTVESAVKNHDSFFRCHKSYLVNLDKIKHLSGNAQGYKLHLDNIDELIPISRRLNETLKQRLSIHP
jgi:hypothetical protein